MNRLFTLSAIALTILLSSCMKTTKNEYDPIQGGLEIYNAVSQTNTTALDPTNIAVRLNTLIYEAAHAEPVITDLDKVKVPNPDKPAEMIDISKALFGNASVKLTDPTTGTYTITYSQDYYNTQTDRVRHGVIIINTGNKSLYEVGGSNWTLSLSSEKGSALFLDAGNSYESLKIYYGWSYYAITGYGNGSIAITTTFEGYVNENYKTDWRLRADIGLSSTEGFFTYKDVKTNVTVACNSSGKILGNTSNFEYETSIINPLVYQPSCNWQLKNEGTEIASFPDGPTINPERYPAADVDVTWSKSDKDCKVFVDITYNGITKRI